MICESSGCSCSGKNKAKNNVEASKDNPAAVGFDPAGIAIPFLSKGEKLAAKKLTSGTYEINAAVDAGNKQPISKDDFKIEIPVNGELKRVDVSRMQISAEKGEPGSKKSILKMTFKIVDNPIPIAFIIYGVLSTAGLSAGSYFVNSLNKFTGSLVGQVAALAAIAAAGYTIIKK